DQGRVKRLVLCFALLAPAAATPSDLHQQPVGTRVTREFTLGPSIFYVPDGEWVLAAKHVWTGTMGVVMEGPKFAGVFLFDVHGRRVARAIWVSTNIEAVQGTRGW